jgi:hypothetical protein
LGWKNRRNYTSYYYRSVRVGGRVVSRYAGCHELGQVAELIDLMERAERRDRDDRARLEREAAEAEDRARGATSATVDAIASLALELAGYHRPNRSRWRRRRRMPKSLEGPAYAGELGPEPVGIEQETDLNAVLRAIDGDHEAIPAVRRLFARDPAGMIETCGGNLARRVERRLVGIHAKKDRALELALERKLVALRAELAGERPTPLERLLVERRSSAGSIFTSSTMATSGKRR